MTTRGQRRFVYGQTAWMTGSIVALSLLGVLTLELFFVASLVGFLLLMEVTASVTVTPRWRARLKWLVLLGLLGFAYVTGKQILSEMPAGWV